MTIQSRCPLNEIDAMSKKRFLLYTIACVVVPIVFAAYVNLSYSIALSDRQLPFLGAREWRWWVAFAFALIFGSTCVVIAGRRGGLARIFWSSVYAVVMAVVLASVHLAVACGRGDCL
jgi:FtsH-binding integral membrane protein